MHVCRNSTRVLFFSKSIPAKNTMVASVGIEPTTPRFSVLCSANWAMKPHTWRFRWDLNPRSLAWQASVITTTPRNHFGCGSWIWTNDLWVMSPTSYRAAPSRDNFFGGGKGIRTPAPISRPVGFQDRSLQPDLGIPPYVFACASKHSITL